MELKEQAFKLYRKSHNHPSFDSEAEGKMKDTIRSLLRKYLSKVRFKNVFLRPEIRDTVVQTVNKIRDTAELEKASLAFLELERYFLLLHDFPWKKEFQTLKMYGGYINCHVCSHLVGVENIFLMAGFREMTKPGLLSIVDFEINADSCMQIAFECVLGSAECRHLHAIACGQDISATIALQWHSSPNFSSLTLTPTPPAPSETATKPAHSERLEGRSNHLVSTGGRTGGEGGMAVRGMGRDMVDLPYIDEDVDLQELAYEEATLDEHMAASLVALRREGQGGAGTVERKTSRSCMEEWDFVRNSLPPSIPHHAVEARPGVAAVPMEEDEGIEMEQLRNFAAPAPGLGVTSLGMAGPRRGLPGNVNNGSDSAYLTDIYFPPSSTSDPYATNDVKSTALGMPVQGGRPMSYADSVSRDSRLQERSIQARMGATFPQQHLYPECEDGVVVRERISPVYTRNSTSWPTSGICPAPPLSAPLRPNPALTIEQVALPTSSSLHPSRNVPRCGDSRRVCQMCTLENNAMAVECAACRGPLGKTNTQTYV